ncbi:hypothetical protein [Anaerocaecibacter muris]|uniref:hypothetical protein n=1 Tax=Anaerocaecibacter muris TaxID=2941513 RepID=UPI0020422B55|nr:hypothetical protein [Anaerocaecibacter muris]
MSKKDNNRPRRKCTSELQKRAIRKSYAISAAKKKEQKQNNVGKVYRGETKYIDREPKKQRDYVVVRDTERGVTVSKLKIIKKLDNDGKNADTALVEINHERYGLPNRTGVDYERFDKNRMSGKPLRIEDKDVFPEQQERFTLSNRDRDHTLIHTGVKKPNRRKKKK